MFADNKIDEFSKEKKEIDILFNKMDFDAAESKLDELKRKVSASPKASASPRASASTKATTRPTASPVSEQ